MCVLHWLVGMKARCPRAQSLLRQLVQAFAAACLCSGQPCGSLLRKTLLMLPQGMPRRDTYLGFLQRQRSAAKVARTSIWAGSSPGSANPSSSSQGASQPCSPCPGNASSWQAVQSALQLALSRQPALILAPLWEAQPVVSSAQRQVPLGGPCASLPETTVLQPAQGLGQEQASSVGSPPVKHLVSPAGHSASALGSTVIWSLPVCAWLRMVFWLRRFLDILSVRLCDSTVGPYTSKLKKFADFCSRQGYCSFPSTHTVYEYLAFLSLEGPSQAPSFLDAVCSLSSTACIETWVCPLLGWSLACVLALSRVLPSWLLLLLMSILAASLCLADHVLLFLQSCLCFLLSCP
jgi:hypothetical protein